MSDNERNLLEEQKADYQWYEASGSHFDIGFITAQHAGSEAFFSPGGKLSAAQLSYAEKCRAVTAKYYPEIVEEFAGYASALNLPEEDLLGHYTIGATGGCSAIVVDTPEGRIVGRNYDFFYFESRRHLIHTRPDKGYSHTGIREGLIGGRFDGLYERGLFVSFGNASGPVPPFALTELNNHGSLFATRPKLNDYVARRRELLQGADTLFAAVINGTLHVPINRAYALKDAAKAHADLEGRLTTGAAILKPQ